jgi:ABC-type multidrug transport system, ATPase component
MLDQIDLADRAQDKIRNLSGGQMRRVEIARALLHRPRLLVLDEPTVGLDVKSRADILAQMRRLVAREGTCVLWATHLIDEVSADDDVIVCITVMCWPAGRSHAWCRTPAPTDIRSAFARLTKISTPDAPDEAV